MWFDEKTDSRDSRRFAHLRFFPVLGLIALVPLAGCGGQFAYGEFFEQCKP